MSVSVHRLVQRGAERDRVRERIALEDALASALPQDGRLVLVRHMRVSGRLADPGRRQQVVRQGWVEAVAGAVHGTSSFAARSNCVWFASRAEAEEVLLRKLLAGGGAEGWFWALAVPDWQRLPLGEWLPLRIGTALDRHDGPALASMAETCIRGDMVALFVEAANRAMTTPDGVAAGLVADDPVFDPTAPAHAAKEAETSALASSIAAKLEHKVLPRAWRELLARIDSPAGLDAGGRAIVAAIVGERVRRISPALALEPALLRKVVETLLARSTGRAVPQAPVEAPQNGGPAKARAASPRPSLESRSFERRADTLRDNSDTRQVVPEAAGNFRKEAPLPSPEFAPEPSPFVRSRHAGLWLVLPSLIRLGFREWLAQHPVHLGEDPGRALILAISRHHRIEPGDPALAIFGIEEWPNLPDWTRLWCTALDRWLRRTAHRRVHDLVSRHGSLVLSDDRLDIHFPIEDADLRLRRLALDSDPGWTDWLGFSVRYHFGSGEPG